MRVFIYEFITGGGLMGDGNAPTFPTSLLTEGSAMLAALVADFGALAGVEVTIMRDHRVPAWALSDCEVVSVTSAEQEQATFARCVAQADWTVVIAPEFEQHLFTKCRMVETSGGRLLGPSSEIVRLAGDKHAMAEHLIAAGISAPEGRILDSNEPWPVDFTYRAVMKPRDGAGSLDVHLVERDGVGSLFRATTSSNRMTTPEKDSRPLRPMRLERFYPGLAASVAVLCGPRGNVALTPCQQRLSDDGRFTYLGGSLPLEPFLARRATDLAQQAVGTLPQPLGYLGVDLVLGEKADGNDDVVIEINPRLTTSYVGLRVATIDNLAGAMLAVAEGKPPALRCRPGRVEFDADGTFRTESTRGGRESFSSHR